jgi:two-component system response regulator
MTPERVILLVEDNHPWSYRDRLESHRLGANSYVRNPVDFAEFERAAGQLGLYWLNLNEPPPAIARTR